jgi:predicted amidohydrolase
VPLRVGLVQFRASDDPSDNRRRLRVLLDRAVGSGADLVICPEAAMCGFGRPTQPLAPVAEPLDGPFVTSLVEAAEAANATLVAGMFEAAPDGGAPYNTVVAVNRGGLLGYYRKLHLFDAAGWVESERLATVPVSEEALLLLDVGDLRVGVLTCYDLRFPELARALVDRGATALALPAAWVAGPLKEEQWRVLTRARAVENGVWVLAAGQPGPQYAGRSAIIDPAGVEVAACADGEGIAVADVGAERVGEVRARMPSLAHRRFRVVPAEPSP